MSMFDTPFAEEIIRAATTLTSNVKSGSAQNVADDFECIYIGICKAIVKAQDQSLYRENQGTEPKQ